MDQTSILNRPYTKPKPITLERNLDKPYANPTKGLELSLVKPQTNIEVTLNKSWTKPRETMHQL